MNKISIVSVVLCLFLLSSCVKEKSKVLIIGDSISIGYTPFVKEHFLERAVVSHNPGNAQHTGTGLENIDQWIGDEEWDIVQFNWGLWDLCYRNPDSKAFGHRDKKDGTVTCSVDEYALKLDSIVSIIKSKTKAKLIFVTTTYVPENEVGRFQEDVQIYNEAAIKIMKRHSIMVNDINEKSALIHKEQGKGIDNVHYTSEGYKQLSKLIINFIEEQL